MLESVMNSTVNLFPMDVKELPLSEAIVTHLESRLVPLPSHSNPMVYLDTPKNEMERAGLLPFVVTTDPLAFSYYVMKPHPKHLGSKGVPLFQIAKGTRFYQRENDEGELEWVDGKETGRLVNFLPEQLLRTALREGIEEIALEPLAIRTLFDVGPVAFRSEQTAIGKSMWLYVAQFEEQAHLPALPPSHPTTEATQWVTLEEFRRIGRPDHVMIVSEVEKSLTYYFDRKTRTA